MSERNPFDQNPGAPKRNELLCEQWEALLVDALDGTLQAADRAAFDFHGKNCEACSVLLEQAQRGQEWLRFLHTEPQVPADLVTRILDQTSGAGVPALAGAGAVALPVVPVAPFWKRLSVPVGVRRAADTRLLMTAAMAFFSIALTLNLAGVRLTSIRIADLKPSTLRVNLTRQFYSTHASVVRYYDNLRFVYEVEAKMRELRRDAGSDEPNQPKAQPSSNPNGSARKNGGKSEAPRQEEPRSVIWGQPVQASLEGFRSLESSREAESPRTQAFAECNEEVGPLVGLTQDQAERSLA